MVGVLAAAELRFGDHVTATYLALSLALPLFWLAAVWLAGGYDVRFIGIGSDEFRKVLNAGVGLTAAIAIMSYAINIQLSRGYLLIAVPSTTLLDLVSRFALRKRLHRMRAVGRCILSVVAMGHKVGPRPALPDEAAKYADHVRRRPLVKPGLTGLWQVSGRSDLSWEKPARLDRRYAENWSFAPDRQILWKTTVAAIRRPAAY